jgi:predicted RNase H-like HicB family nuclease
MTCSGIAVKYEVIIYWSEDDQAFIAEVPERPGCMGDGKAYRGALRAVERVAKEWIETARKLGREIPQPKGRLRYA